MERPIRGNKILSFGLIKLNFKQIQSIFNLKDEECSTHKLRKPQFTQENLNQFKLKQKKINKCHKIIKEILFNFMFIWVLFVNFYSSRNANSFNYYELILKNFNEYQNVKFQYLTMKNYLKLKNIPHFIKGKEHRRFLDVVIK